jgi:hypothetical protein
VAPIAARFREASSNSDRRPSHRDRADRDWERRRERGPRESEPHQRNAEGDEAPMRARMMRPEQNWAFEDESDDRWNDEEREREGSVIDAKSASDLGRLNDRPPHGHLLEEPH